MSGLKKVVCVDDGRAEQHVVSYLLYFLNTTQKVYLL